MAGTKETPRQRMIGMMYLVLTALLALQVSSAMIYKFQSLNESMEHSIEETNSWNNNKLSSIAKEVKRRGNRANEIKLVSQATETSRRSKEMIDYIEKIKKDMIMVSGGYDADGELKGAKEETKIEVMMIGQNKNGKGYELKRKLEEYVKVINQNSSTKFSPLALDAKDDPLFKNKDAQKNKDFAELNFGQTPLVASLAILSEIESRIATMEATTLAALSEKIALDDYKFDKLTPMASPVSRVIAAGTKYEAQVFMTATSSTLQPSMQLEGKNVNVNESGVGRISFTASGGNYIDGSMKKTWTGKITMKQPNGKDTTYTISEDYIVTKPVIQIQAGAVQALYRNCGNKFNIQVPALGNSYNPKIVAEGANVIQGTNKGFVTVLPTGSSVNLKVSSEGNFIGEEKFRVKLIPAPTIEVKVNGKKVDPLIGVEAFALRNVSVRAIAEKDFAAFLPDDATYKISKWKITLARGKNSPISPKQYVIENVNVGSDIGASAKQNDRLIVEILKVKRKNFRGDWEDVNIPKTVHIIPIN